MKTLRFDVMRSGSYVCTLSYKFCPAFPIMEDSLREFVCSKRPALRGMEFCIKPVI